MQLGNRGIERGLQRSVFIGGDEGFGPEHVEFDVQPVEVGEHLREGSHIGFFLRRSFRDGLGALCFDQRNTELCSQLLNRIEGAIEGAVVVVLICFKQALLESPGVDGVKCSVTDQVMFSECSGQRFEVGNRRFDGLDRNE